MELRRVEPGPGQESVWDHPRPPALERTEARLRVEIAGEVVADTAQGWRVLETSQPPADDFPPEDVRADLLVPSTTATFCEWKGLASYVSVRVAGRLVTDAAWRYDRPTDRFAPIAGHRAFYPERADACWVDDERVAAGDGSSYGGWITSKVVGPFKGGAGTAAW